ncbi:hypothetical protein MNBD_BACTEROID05-1226 [hydrothermal vent metagenome]|uniref:Four helix bundle protein n=1 Tax=hydrothermal vent metagenome TaxID=652676 RepID=A0A3B0U1L2_9ZZZZ
MQEASYKKLIAYQKSFDLVKRVYKLTGSFPKAELYGIVSQIRRASVSVPINIAEGYMRGTKEYRQFLKIALGSSAEVETLLCLSKELNFVSSLEYEKIYGINLEVIDHIHK